MHISEIEKILEAGRGKITPHMLGVSQVINDVDLFISGHISFLKANAGKRRFLPYYNRLLKIAKQL